MESHDGDLLCSRNSLRTPPHRQYEEEEETIAKTTGSTAASRTMKAFHCTCLGLLLLLTRSNNSWALTPDGGKWFHPGRPFTVAHQTPTRHVGKDGTRLQSDPYGMPSYGHLDEDAFVPVREDPSMAVMDFGRPPSYHRREPYRPEPRRPSPASAAGASTRPSAAAASPPSEPPIREYERQEYFRPRRVTPSPSFSSFNNHDNRRNHPYQGQRPVGMGMPSYNEQGEEEFFFAGHPSFVPEFDHGGIPSFFQHPPSSPPPPSRPTPSFSFAGRPSTSFHQRPLQPNFY